MVEEPIKPSKISTKNTTASNNFGNSNFTSGKCNSNSKSKSRRSNTRVLLSSSSQVPVKVAPVRRPIRRHRQSSEQSLEEFPSLASDGNELGQAGSRQASKSTTYAQVLATANATIGGQERAIDSPIVLGNVNANSSSLSPSSQSSNSTNGNNGGKAPAILVVDQQLLKKKGTGSPKSKKSRRHEATDEEWFMTPPPCFTRPNTFDMAQSPIEDMLIEQPVPNTETPSTPSSIELDTCSLSSRESSLQGRRGDDCQTPSNFVEGEKEKEEQGDDEEEKKDHKKKEEEVLSSTKLTTTSSSLEQKSCKVATTKVETAALPGEVTTSPHADVVATATTTKGEPVMNLYSPADSQGEEEEEQNENWVPPVVKARQRLNSKGRLALDTYTVVSRKERRKKKKTSSKSTASGSNNGENGNTSSDKHSSDWTRPAWSDASVANGSTDAVGASSASTASFGPSLKLMLRAVNRAHQEKIHWITSASDFGHCKSGPVRRKDKYAARPHSFSLNRKTNRNF